VRQRLVERAWRSCGGLPRGKQEDGGGLVMLGRCCSALGQAGDRARRVERERATEDVVDGATRGGARGWTRRRHRTKGGGVSYGLLRVGSYPGGASALCARVSRREAGVQRRCDPTANSCSEEVDCEQSRRGESWASTALGLLARGRGRVERGCEPPARAVRGPRTTQEQSGKWARKSFDLKRSSLN
jgi:hypothetical protein